MQGVEEYYVYSPNAITSFVDHVTAVAYFVLIGCGLTGLLIRPARRTCGHALSIASAVVGLDIWLWSISIVHSWWGIVGVIFGLVLAGVGVVPMALMAAALHHDWLPFGYLILNFVILFICNFAANSMLESSDRHRLNAKLKDGYAPRDS